jgi:hypothetical protein
VEWLKVKALSSSFRITTTTKRLSKLGMKRSFLLVIVGICEESTASLMCNDETMASPSDHGLRPRCLCSSLLVSISLEFLPSAATSMWKREK